MKIVILESKDYSENALKKYNKLGEVEFFDTSNQTIEEVLKNADVVVVRLAHQLTADLLSQTNISMIATPTTGLDHIDIPYTQEKNITVLSLKGETEFLNSISATPEHTLGLILASLRNTPQAHDHVKKGGWDRNLFKGFEVKNRTFGFYGCGRVAKLLGTYLQAMGAKIIAYDPLVSEEVMQAQHIKKVNREEVFKKAQSLIILAPLNEETENSISIADFKLMQKGSQFINTARGQIINEDDLCTAVEMGIFSKVAVDVLAHERSGGQWIKKSPLWKLSQTHQNIIITPHIAGATYDSMHATEDFIADKVTRHLKV